MHVAEISADGEMLSYLDSAWKLLLLERPLWLISRLANDSYNKDATDLAETSYSFFSSIKFSFIEHGIYSKTQDETERSKWR
jgi:hypothetical protein